MNKLTPQQEKFSQLVASGKSQSDAYRGAYPRCLKWAAKTVHENASRMSANSKVSARIAELRKPIADAAQMSMGGHLSELSRLKMLAEAKDNVPAAIRAEELRGRVAGYYIERTMKVPSLLDEFEPSELREFLKRLTHVPVPTEIH